MGAAEAWLAANVTPVTEIHSKELHWVECRRCSMKLEFPLNLSWSREILVRIAQRSGWKFCSKIGSIGWMCPEHAVPDETTEK